MNTREQGRVRTGARHGAVPGGMRLRARRSQRGAIAPIAGIAIVIAVAALGVLDLANLYLQRRALQNVADLAALAAVQQMDDACQQPPVVATANAQSNGFTVEAPSQTLAVTCGRWDATGGGGMTFVANGPTPLNGVMVTATKTVPYFFLGPQRTIEASATAKATVVGGFSLATSLAQVNLLNGALGSLLGTNLNLQAVSWNGIVDANVRLADLAAVATTAGTTSALLKSEVTVSGLATLMASALEHGGVDASDATVAGLQAFAASTAGSNVQIPLGNASSTPGLLSLGLADPESTGNVSLNALQTLMVAAEIAQSGHPAIQSNVSVSGLPGTVKLGINVLSPPSIAVGEPGANPDASPPWRTYAHNAQITVSLTLGLSVAGVVNAQLPLYVEVAPATAWLQSAQCAPTAAQSESVIGVQTGIANLCIGSPPGTSAQFSSSGCGGTPAEIGAVAPNLLGLGGLLNGLLGGSGSSLIEVDANLSFPLASATAQTLTFEGSGNLLSNSQSGSSGSSVNTNGVAGAVGNGLTTLTGQLNQGLNVSVAGQSIGAGVLASAVAGPLVSTLTPLLSTVDNALLAPLLQLLGAQIGVATVTDFPLSCGVAQLVR